MGLHSENVEDVASSSNFKQVRTTKLNLDLDVNFETKKITGVLEITFMSLKDNLNTVILDIHNTLKVSIVKCGETNAPFSVKEFTDYGESLVVELPKEVKKDEKFNLEIEYQAGEGSSICWLEPEQTADKVKPYMYTQEGFTAVMSANKKSFGEKANRKGDTNCFSFEQTVPIQSYLIVLAVGHIKSARIGPRSEVWAEPSVLESARNEFDGVVEDFLKTGEQLFGPYVWGTYDILVMPPSFPYGGMENPCLTFVTPCIIVGDKSLTGVIIHEITHSWFGNLVTNANWSEFWLNEGFTMFGQRRISETLYGRASMCLEATTGQNLLHRHIEHNGHDHPLTRLRVIIEKGVDPDDTYNETPYEKGFSFVCYLQSLVNDVKKFDEFLRAYIQKFKYQSIVAEDLFDFFLDYFPELKEKQVHEREGFDFTKTWLQGTGHSPYKPDLSASAELTGPVDLEIKRVTEIDVLDKPQEISLWTTYQLMYFLDDLSAKSPLSDASKQRLVLYYPILKQSRNAEIRQRWCEVVIKNEMLERKEDIRSFLHSQGKQKYTKPLYELMMKASEELQKFALEVYHETERFLHVNVRSYVRKIVGLDN
ncbi:aminopeptidase B [Biomphalaria pfeifferi]|uniref:Aminopeptidase B n=1 Tax=Biomphalaria pfeifferi TaxID=112525 RepID=A0AAD8FHR4_BIOPF|nr:aminopeptidase B [Biomphalaria pfeifferi]